MVSIGGEVGEVMKYKSPHPQTQSRRGFGELALGFRLQGLCDVATILPYIVPI